jgi:hypothetical protein
MIFMVVGSEFIARIMQIMHKILKKYFTLLSELIFLKVSYYFTICSSLQHGIQQTDLQLPRNTSGYFPTALDEEICRRLLSAKLTI